MPRLQQIFILRKVSVVVIFFALAACKKHPEGMHNGSYAEGLVEKTSKDFVIPRQLKAEIDKEFIANIRKENPKIVLVDEELLNKIPRDFLDVDLYLENAQGSAKALREPTVFRLPRGGGVVDLKDAVNGSKGSFFVRFAVKEAGKKEAFDKKLHVYYMSDAQQRVLDGEKFGAGCDRYMDISKFFASQFAGEGLRANATDQRYLAVLAGTYFFIGMDSERKIHIAAVRVVDSRYPDFMCEKADAEG